MAKIGIPYYVVKKGRGYWQPKKEIRDRGFYSVPCGPDGPEAWKVAEQWNSRWQAVRQGLTPSPALASADNLSPHQIEELTVYPSGSIGDGFRRYRQTEEWRKKAPATREDWWRGWKRIKPIFGDVDPRTVTLEQISDWRKRIEDQVSLREAHRALKIWRALWLVIAAMRYCRRDDDPSKAVRNSAPRGRSATWSEGEVALLAKTAWRLGYYGLAAVIAVALDTQMNPGDIRALRASQLATHDNQSLFFTDRAKTGIPVGGLLTRRTLFALKHYLASLGVELHGQAHIFRNRSGAPYSKDTLGDDFRAVRRVVFGPLEQRKLGFDIRRSGAVEAISGEAQPAAVAHAMGNTLNSSNTLFATYVPVNVATISEVMEARIRGRRKLRRSNG